MLSGPVSLAYCPISADAVQNRTVVWTRKLMASPMASTVDRRQPFPYAVREGSPVNQEQSGRSASEMATSLDVASGLPTIHTGMGCVESKRDGLNPMKRQVRVVHRGSSGCIHDDRVSCRRGNVSPLYFQRRPSGIPISPRCAGWARFRRSSRC